MVSSSAKTTLGSLRNRTPDVVGRQIVCDRDVQGFTTLDCNIPTARGLRLVADEGTPVLVANRLKM